MVGRTALGFLALTLTCVGSAFAESYVLPVSITAGPLSSGLQTLARETGIELLFDSDSITGLQSPAVHGDLTTDAALRELLAETDLTVRRAESGAWIVEPPAAPALARPDAAVPEILVIGQRTENADIRRTENDVQPYTVATKEEIVGAHRDNVDGYFQSRVSENAQVIPESLLQRANTLSQIDLRGLGSGDTLVLIDGRRMPSIPMSGLDFHQPDLNPIPLHAIERIEVLTGAAGGIYGFGALGGVVNVVLDRSNRGLEVDLTGGISSRGDAGRKGVEVSFGHTSGDGQTDLSAFAAYSESDPLLAGQRGFALRDREFPNQLGEQAFLFEQPGNSVGVFSGLLGPNPLVFKPQFGGATLPSDHTFLPAGFSGNAAALTAALTQHAGQIDTSLSQGVADSDLLSNPRTESLLLNARHRFGDRLEAYVDAVVLRSRGESADRAASSTGLLSPDSPANPFTNIIAVQFPVSNMVQQFSTHAETERYTAGLLGELPFGWRATAEAGVGSSRYSLSSLIVYPSNSFFFLLGDPSDPQINPFGNWNAFQQSVSADPSEIGDDVTYRNRFRDDSLRLAGPVFTTAQGPTTLTLLAEHRTENIPAASRYTLTESDGTTTISSNLDPAGSTATTSLYAELRSQLFGSHATAFLLRGLQLQLAVRRDDQSYQFTNADDNEERVRFVGTAYTAGAKVTPWPWLMLRASYATGEEPPPVADLDEAPDTTSTTPVATDPKRGGIGVGSEGPYVLKSGGYAGLKAVRATTAFFGAVLTPFGQDGLRLAIDFSRIRKTDDILTYLSEQTILDHEDFWPQRVTRGPLTDADRALGYTAGPVTAIDARYTNGASMHVEALDMHVDWPVSFLKGRLRLYAEGTHQLNNVEEQLFQPDIHNAGYLDGPLKWRANGGFDWTRRPLTIGANVQYFGSTLIAASSLDGADLFGLKFQGSNTIPSQTYVDLHAGWRFPIPVGGQSSDLALDLGVINVLDKAPPRVSSVAFLGPGYSRYGDPRQRRFELVLSAHF